VLREVEEDPDREEVGPERRPAVREERQRDSLGGDEREDDRDVERAWATIITERPIPRRRPNESGAFTAALTPRAKTRPKSARTATQPARPSSSPTIA
jgi:hypothetical protein